MTSSSIDEAVSTEIVVAKLQCAIALTVVNHVCKADKIKPINRGN